ncbi:hypothetical protein P280DRAFT_506830 [Massarina eburnea CBS 473.64]|uniref:Zn-dependent exopeptidase n=1 Tax=Massarina eburnea CBS 473.64 TaxID=1395130 RepID=A0A6A6S4X1_9PLEO|nr:hypothetical protein P280DRAFT_506830 [Massarina eburnea CBS 473.64]
MQHPDVSTLATMTAEIETFIRHTAAVSGLEIAAYENVWTIDPFKFDEGTVECVEAAAREGGFKYKRPISHTGHDSIYTNFVVSTAMVFTPCVDGISHSPKEWVSEKDCRIGAQVVLGAVLRNTKERKHSSYLNLTVRCDSTPAMATPSV